MGSGFHTFIVKLGNNYTGLSLTAQQTNRKRTEPEGVGAVPAHARGGGRGGGSEKDKRQKETEIITNQWDCARSARDGGGVGAGRGPFPGGARRWEVALTERNTTPVWAPDAPKTPLPTPPPNTRERHGPPPHSENRRRHSLLLPTGRHTRLGTPWARNSPPSQRSPA